MYNYKVYKLYEEDEGQHKFILNNFPKNATIKVSQKCVVNTEATKTFEFLDSLIMDLYNNHVNIWIVDYMKSAIYELMCLLTNLMDIKYDDKNTNIILTAIAYNVIRIVAPIDTIAPEGVIYNYQYLKALTLINILVEDKLLDPKHINGIKKQLTKVAYNYNSKLQE